MSKDEFELIRGSGNVIRDFDDPDADVKQAKAILAAQIIGLLDDRRLTVRKVAGMTGFAAADFSRVRNADLGRFTLDRLIRMLGALDDGIEVTIQFAPRTAGRAAPQPA
jgi:predicted XRE-type DNA-binding protein